MPRISFLRFASRLSAFLILGAPLGCSDPLRPSDLEGIYVLERIGSDAIPAVYLTDQYFRVHLVADTLRLHEDGTGMRTGLLHYESLNGGDGTVQDVPVANEFTFKVVDRRIEIAFTCDDVVRCAAPQRYVGRVTREGLRVDYALGGRAPLVYRTAGEVD